MTYDDSIWHNDGEQKEWFFNEVLRPRDDAVPLVLCSNDIGDDIGEVRVLSIKEGA